MDEIELYESANSDLCGYPFDGSGGGQAGCTSNNTATLVYDMDGIEDSFVVLDYRNNEGSGKRDMKLLVPNSLFSQDPNCNFQAVGCTIYVTLYSQFGGDVTCFKVGTNTCPNNGGYEEWGARNVEPTAVTLRDLQAKEGSPDPLLPVAILLLVGIGASSFLWRRGRLRQLR